MNQKIFEFSCFAIALIFAVIFAAVVVPALLDDGDFIGAFAAGFVNPYASGYSTDVILCWVTLAVWILYDRHTHSLKGGWVCLILGLVPGVAVGLPLYLVLRNRQLQSSSR